MPPSGQRTGVLVLTAWLEHQASPLRVRITERIDVRASEEGILLIAGAEAAMAAVRDWLIRFESEAARPIPDNQEEERR